MPMQLVDVDRYTGQPIYADDSNWLSQGLTNTPLGDGSDAFLAAYARAQETAAAQVASGMFANLDPRYIVNNYDNGTWSYEPPMPALADPPQDVIPQYTWADQPVVPGGDSNTPSDIAPGPNYTYTQDPTVPSSTLDTVWSKGNTPNLGLANFSFLGLTGIAAVVLLMSLMNSKKSKYN